MESLTGMDHVDRLPIILSQNNEFQLLGVPEMESGTGWNTAHAVFQVLMNWGVIDDVVAMCFDTCFVNTGHIQGAAYFLQLLFERDLLQLACRRHIYELVLKAAFESKFGKSSAPIPPLFKRFKDQWSTINQNEFEAGISDPIIKAKLSHVVSDIAEFCKDQLKIKSVRHDYEEFLQLCLVFVGDRSRSFPFRAPGAMSNARWMSKALYCLKMFMFKSQFHLTAREENAMRDFLVFVIRFYVKAWFTCTKAVEAPYNDMTFLKGICDYETVDKILSVAVSKTFSNHLWYMSSECIAFSLFDSNVPIAQKNEMAKFLSSCSVDDEIEKNNRLKISVSQLSWFREQELSDFVTPHALSLFDRFKLSRRFLKKDASSWEHDKEYLKAKSVLKSLTVVNDSAERGVKLIEDYNKHLTKDEEDLQFLLQAVSQYRKQFPSYAKKDLQ